MNELLDLEKVYGTLYSTWDKIRVDILSHAFVIFTLFFMARVSLPRPSLTSIDAACVLENSYFKLAKESGLLLLAPVVVLAVVIAYGLLVRTIGGWITSFLTIVFTTPNDPIVAGDVETVDLVTIAATQGSSKWSHFTVGDLRGAISDLMLRYSNVKLPKFVGKDALLYVGYASVSLLCWLLLLALLPESFTWRQKNQNRLLLEGLFLLIFFIGSWLRYREAVRKLPAGIASFVAANVRADDNMKPVLAEAESHLAEITQQVERLKQPMHSPSILRYLEARFSTRSTTAKPEQDNKPGGLRRLLQEGHEFGTNPRLNQTYNEQWLQGYFAYLTYRLVQFVRVSLMQFAVAPFVLVGRVVLGAEGLTRLLEKVSQLAASRKQH